MNSQKQRLSILFVCTGNACRSQISEGWARRLLRESKLADEFDIEVASAGLETHGLNPHAVTVMQEVGVDIGAQTSDLLAEPLNDVDWLITLCDHANQHCPTQQAPCPTLCNSQKQRLSILFVCTGNACRSQISEGWARRLLRESKLADEFDIEVASAGLETHGLNPHAVTVMQEVGVDIGAQTSDLLAEPLNDVDWLITLCDHANQHCPTLTPEIARLHWSLADSASAPTRNCSISTKASLSGS